MTTVYSEINIGNILETMQSHFYRERESSHWVSQVPKSRAEAAWHHLVNTAPTSLDCILPCNQGCNPMQLRMLRGLKDKFHCLQPLQLQTAVE